MHNLKRIDKKSQQVVSGDLDFKLIWEGIKSVSTFIWNRNEVRSLRWYLYIIAMNIVSIDCLNRGPRSTNAHTVK